MPITHALNPVAFSLGPLAIRWYALVYVAGFLLAYWLLLREVRKKRIKGMDEKLLDEFMALFILGTILGGRLFYVLVYNPLYYWAHPLHILATWEGGMSFHGGLLGASLAALWFCKRRRISFYALADRLVAPLALALVFGRIANFVNGELPGTVADPVRVPWCVYFPGYDGCRHPSQLYEAAYGLVLFGVLLLSKARMKLKEGTLFWLFVLLYGVFRLVANIVRAPDPTDPLFLGLLLGQWLSLIMIGLGAYFLLRREKNGKKRS